jgi:hypothetical protein
MVMGKIIKRHMSLLERQANTRTFIVADLNNPAQVAEADRQMAEGSTPLSSIVVDVDQHQQSLSVQSGQPKGKEFDTYY